MKGCMQSAERVPETPGLYVLKHNSLHYSWQFHVVSKDTKRLPKNPFVRRVRLLMKYFFQFDPAFSNNNICKRKVVLVYRRHWISCTKSLHSSEKLWSMWDIFIQLNQVGWCNSTTLEVCSEGTSVNVAILFF
jgi:hypothetical protein